MGNAPVASLLLLPESDHKMYSYKDSSRSSKPWELPEMTTSSPVYHLAIVKGLDLAFLSPHCLVIANFTGGLVH